MTESVTCLLPYCIWIDTTERQAYLRGSVW